MSVFENRDGEIHVEDVALARIAEAVGTPAYVYSSRAMEEAYVGYREAFEGLDASICYALKANSSLAVIRTFAALGAGADVVSGGELAQALAAGVPANRIVFAGVGKTRDEMARALDAGIMEFNVESDSELRVLSEVAVSRGRAAPVAVRIQSRRRRGDAREDFDRPQAGQVRHPLGARDGNLPSGGRPAGNRGRRNRRPHRLAVDQPQALPRGVRADGGTRPPPAGRRRGAPAARSRRWPRHRLPWRAAARAVGLCPGGARDGGRSRPRAGGGAGTLARRQRRPPALPRDLRQGRRQAFRHLRCGDERPDPADPL